MHTAPADRALQCYVADIDKYPLLTRAREVELATIARQTGNHQAAQRLVVSNLRFVVKCAYAYRGYGLKLLDLIQEGNIGLMVAVKKFDPAKGYRLISYAVWWIRAYMQSYIMRAWSLVKIGTTQAQRKLFFRLRSQRQQASGLAGDGEDATHAWLAATLRVEPREVINMEARLTQRDYSLDATAMDGGRTSHLDMLGARQVSQEDRLAKCEMRHLLQQTVSAVMLKLNAKERYIIDQRILREQPTTLQEIGQHLHLSRERVRQIEGMVVGKLRHALTNNCNSPAAA